MYLAWTEDLSILLRGFFGNLINVLINGAVGCSEWKFTGFYETHFSKNKKECWDTFKALGMDNMFPWLMCRDFNKILYVSEKRGSVPKEEGHMERFHDALRSCDFMDIGFLSPWFTWERGNSMRTNIRETFDRRVANDSWMSLFPIMGLRHLPTSTSDHCPLLLDLVGQFILLKALFFDLRYDG